MIYAIFKADVKRPEALASYREQAAVALAKHGGKVEQATPSPTALDGSPTITNVAAVLSFPDKGAAHAWINDPELAALHELRRSIGHTKFILLG
jgi:uncharacterized protein (DUF1330 family)